MPEVCQIPLPDVQSQIRPDQETLILAGVDRIALHVRLPDTAAAQPGTVGIVALVPKGHRGVHMSRLIRTLAPDGAEVPLDERLLERVKTVGELQGTELLECVFRTTVLVARQAPVTGSRGLHPVTVGVEIRWTPSDGMIARTRFSSAALLGCPCSKALSGEAGYHNQRGLLALEVDGLQLHRLDALLAVTDAAASSAVYPVLRRQDEKDLIDAIERNAKHRFVEDACRLLAQEARTSSFDLTGAHVRSLESIHAHDAVAWTGASGRALGDFSTA